MRDQLVEQAGLGALPGTIAAPVVAAACSRPSRVVRSNSALRLVAAVAFDAMLFEQRGDLAVEQFEPSGVAGLLVGRSLVGQGYFGAAKARPQIRIASTGGVQTLGRGCRIEQFSAGRRWQDALGGSRPQGCSVAASGRASHYRLSAPPVAPGGAFRICPPIRAAWAGRGPPRPARPSRPVG